MSRDLLEGMNPLPSQSGRKCHLTASESLIMVSLLNVPHRPYCLLFPINFEVVTQVQSCFSVTLRLLEFPICV